MKTTPRQLEKNELTILRIFRLCSGPLTIFALALVLDPYVNAVSIEPYSIRSRILTYMLLGSALFTLLRTRATSIDYALCFLPYFILALILFF